MRLHLFLLILITIMAMLAGCGEAERVSRPTVWVLGGPDLDSENNKVAGRVGVITPDEIEFGIESQYTDGVDADQTWGAYTLQQFQLVDILGAKQYIGLHASIVDSEDGTKYGFMSGIAVPVTENIDAITEYQFTEYDDSLREDLGTDDDHLFFAGLRLTF